MCPYIRSHYNIQLHLLENYAYRPSKHFSLTTAMLGAHRVYKQQQGFILSVWRQLYSLIALSKTVSVAPQVDPFLCVPISE